MDKPESFLEKAAEILIQAARNQKASLLKPETQAKRLQRTLENIDSVQCAFESKRKAVLKHLRKT